MGIDAVGARFIAYCFKQGVDYSDICTLGRHSLYINKRDIRRILEKYELEYNQSNIDSIMNGVNIDRSEYGFSDNFLRFLGARSPQSIDASDYEGATIVHDMNKELPSHYFGLYSTVFDGGTLEHVFNFPVAIKNSMNLLRVGGHFLSVCPANNFFGHGFYQFSSELFYRVFSEENGFSVKSVFLALEKSPDSWYSVPDAISLRERITLHNQAPTLMLFCAQKVSDAEPFKEYPQQSDYQQILWQQGANEHWGAHGSMRISRHAALLRKAAAIFPLAVSDTVRALRPILSGSLQHPLKRPHLHRHRG